MLFWRHRETSKGKAWREGQCLALFNFPVLARAAFADLLANWEYRGQVPFPHPTYKALLAINFASRAFFVCRAQAGKRYLPPIFPVFWFGPLGSFGVIFSGPLSKKREKSAKGKKNSCEYGNSFMLNNEVAGEWAVFSAIVSSM
ncbi:MAG: hypothetical protein BHV62_07655 [Eggerthella sp. 51_9]|nr:MAG: hypothetical protein BHV62_07655 [Eggerthella sp. 51_9]